jgi:hypothetical protein
LASVATGAALGRAGLSAAAGAAPPASEATDPDARARDARTLRVGPSQPLRSIAAAAREARDGDTVEVDAGEYAGDVAVWPQKRLTIRARDGRVRLVADGRAAEGKAIWVLRHGHFDVEGFDFTGTSVPARNGAGIRFERGRLDLRACRFADNETGLLAGNHADSELSIEACEFVGAGAGDGLSHNLYVGAIGRLSVRGSHFARGRSGHLLKSRAAVNDILYNRIVDGPGGHASYEVDLPNGGVAVLIGNLVVQEQGTENLAILSYGAEGYRWPRNDLVLSHNTLVNRAPDGTFVRVWPGRVLTLAVNNLWVGRGRMDGFAARSSDGNLGANDRQFADAPGYDYRLAKKSKLRAGAVDPGRHEGRSLRPEMQYRHPTALAPLPPTGRLVPGALQG